MRFDVLSPLLNMKEGRRAQAAVKALQCEKANKGSIISACRTSTDSSSVRCFPAMSIELSSQKTKDSFELLARCLNHQRGAYFTAAVAHRFFESVRGSAALRSCEEEAEMPELFFTAVGKKQLENIESFQ
eukprot:IDg18415t1